MDLGGEIVLTTDNGFFVGIDSRSDANGDKTQPNWDTTLFYPDYWVLKLNADGIKEWDRRFGGKTGDFLYAVIQTKDSGYLLGGSSYSGISGDKTEPWWGGEDYWIVKINPSGVKEWDKRYGGTGKDLMYAGAIQTRDGGYLIGGWSDSGIGGDKTEPNRAGGFYWDYWIVKTDAQGNKQWDRTFGGLQDDMMSAIIETPDGGYLLGGSAKSDSSGDKTEHNWDTTFYLNSTSDYWIVKIDSQGNKQWDKRYGGTNSDRLAKIVPATGGGYILAGTSYSGSGGNKTSNKGGHWLVRIDEQGNKLWDIAYQPGEMTNFIKTIDGGYLSSGYTNAADVGDKTEVNLGNIQTWMIKLDSFGTKQWDKTMFTLRDNRGYAIQTNDGCYAVATSTDSEIGGYKTQAAWDSSIDFWILKFCMEEWNSISPLAPEEDGIQVQVYPNPFIDDLSIAFKAPFGGLGAEATFTITDVTGKAIYHKQETNLAPGYTKVLDLRWLASGVYFVTIEREGECITKRVIKE